MQSMHVHVSMFGHVTFSEKAATDSELRLVFGLNKPEDEPGSKGILHSSMELCVGFDVHYSKMRLPLFSRLPLNVAARFIDAAEILLKTTRRIDTEFPGLVVSYTNAEFDIAGFEDFFWKKIDGKWIPIWYDHEMKEQTLTEELLTELIAESENVDGRPKLTLVKTDTSTE